MNGEKRSVVAVLQTSDLAGDQRGRLSDVTTALKTQAADAHAVLTVRENIISLWENGNPLGLDPRDSRFDSCGADGSVSELVSR